MGGLSSLLFGCSHRNTSRPFTSRRRSVAAGSGHLVLETYIVCLDCGKNFPYSWEEMRVLSNRELVRAKAAAETESPQKFARWSSRHAG